MEPHDDHSSGRATFLGIMLAIVFGAAVVVYGTIIMGPFFFGVLGVVAAIGVLGCVHYLLWGRALDQRVAGEREEETEMTGEIEEFPLDEPHWPRRL